MAAPQPASARAVVQEAGAVETDAAAARGAARRATRPRLAARARFAWALLALTAQAIAVTARQGPIVVDVIEQPKPAEDISISVVLGIFAIAGVFLLAAAVGSALVAGGILLYKRWRDRSAPEPEPTHTRLRI